MVRQFGRTQSWGQRCGFEETRGLPVRSLLQWRTRSLPQQSTFQCQCITYTLLLLMIHGGYREYYFGCQFISYTVISLMIHGVMLFKDSFLLQIFQHLSPFSDKSAPPFQIIRSTLKFRPESHTNLLPFVQSKQSGIAGLYFSSIFYLFQRT